MGWNKASLLYEMPSADIDIGSDGSYYYFVHSYRAAYDHNGPLSEWACTTTQYGQEVFVSSVQRANIFATQFHPEKSGPSGLRLLASWLRAPEHSPPSPPVASLIPRAPVPRGPQPTDGLAKRIIACLDVRANDEGDLVVTKGDQYDVREKTTTTTTANGAVRNLGKPVHLASRYFAQGADEICLLNITSFRSSPLVDQPMLAVVRAAAAEVFVPLTIGGGIKDTTDPDGTPRSALEVAGAYFRAGADKVSIGSEAVYAVEKLLALEFEEHGGKGGKQVTKEVNKMGRTAIGMISEAYGAQAVVVSVDPRRVYVDPQTYDGPYKDEVARGREGTEDAGKAWWYQCTVSGGRESRPLSVVQLAKGSEVLGAGELLINSIDRDGTGKGFDTELINLIKNAVHIPVVASSGAGKEDHFVEVFQKTKSEAALAAGIFHREEVGISAVKEVLEQNGVPVRKHHGLEGPSLP
jgi:glutamine amidotransferase/cyclase